MQLVKPSIEHVDVTSDPIKAIEAAGRTCWKSEDRIAKGTAEKFVQMVMDKKHDAVLEHGNFILGVNSDVYEKILKVEDRQFIRMTCDLRSGGYLISGNPRAFREFCTAPYGVHVDIQKGIAHSLVKVAPMLFKEMLDDHLVFPSVIDFDIFKNVDSLSIAERLAHQVMSYRIVCNRGVTHEIVRHRPFSYAQESTRWCNYKGGVTFIIPPWTVIPDVFNIVQEDQIGREDMILFDDPHTESWAKSLLYSESTYLELLSQGWKPQQARGVLPIDLKAEIVVTGNLQQWRHFFKLRCSPKAHPQMQEVANMILADARTRVPVIFDEVG